MNKINKILRIMKIEILMSLTMVQKYEETAGYIQINSRQNVKKNI